MSFELSKIFRNTYFIQLDKICLFCTHFITLGPASIFGRRFFDHFLHLQFGALDIIRYHLLHWYGFTHITIIKCFCVCSVFYLFIPDFVIYAILFFASLGLIAFHLFYGYFSSKELAL